MKSLLLICYRPPPLWARALQRAPCFYTVRRINGLCVFPGKVEKYAHGHQVRPKRGPWRAKIGMATWRIPARDLQRDCYAAVDIGAAWWWALKTAASIWKRGAPIRQPPGAPRLLGHRPVYGELVRGLPCGAGSRRNPSGIDTWGVDFSCWMLTTTWWATPWPIATSALRACSRWPTPS